MRMKKKTKKRITAILAIFICLMMILPIIAEFFAKPTAQDQLMGQLIEAQFAEEELNETLENEFVEGSYLVTEVVSANTYKILWGDEERTVKLIGVNNNDTYLEEIRDLTEAKLLSLAFDENEEDEEGNFLAYAYLEDGEFLNEKLILEGLAGYKRDPNNVRLDETLESAQVHAKNNGTGIWGTEQP